MNYPTCDNSDLGCPCKRIKEYIKPDDSRPCDCDCHLWDMEPKER